VGGSPLNLWEVLQTCRRPSGEGSSENPSTNQPTCDVMSRDMVLTCLATSFHSGPSVALLVPVAIERELSDQLPVFGDHPDAEPVEQGGHSGAEPPTEPDGEVRL
jgi:hypothetical protein